VLCSTCGREEKCIHAFDGDTEGKKPLVVDEIIIIK
jgi:hypothetical protein